MRSSTMRFTGRTSAMMRLTEKQKDILHEKAKEMVPLLSGDFVNTEDGYVPVFG